MIKVKTCPVCGASSFSKVFSAPYFRGDGELFIIQECQNCSLWLTNPRPADDELGKFYETENYISHTDSRKNIVDHIYHLVRKYSLRRKVSLISNCGTRKGKLLDYGSGTGYFLAEAKSQGWDVYGVEPSEEAREVGKEKFGLKMNAPEEMVWKKDQFDVITLWHVLEHLPELRKHLSHFSGSLKKGGCLIIAVPNHQSDDAKKYGSKWAALDVPLHLYHFKKQNIYDLAPQFGLEVQEVRNMPFDSFYVSMLSEKIANGKTNYIRAFLTGLKSNLKGKSDKNQSSLIYLLRKPF